MTKRRIVSTIFLLSLVQSCSISTSTTSLSGKPDWDHIRYSSYEAEEEVKPRY